MINKESLKHYVEGARKYVQKKDLGNGLHLLKYKRKVFFKSMWNKYLEECRGTIVDSDYNIVTMPFKKIYNFGVEKEAPEIKDTELVTAYLKINGFMAAITVHNNELLISTTGSIDSVFAQRIEEHVSEELRDCILENPNYTYLFECVHKDDPHIIPEVPGLYFLGRRKNEYNSELEHPNNIRMVLPGCTNLIGKTLTMAEAKKEVRACKHEGFVIYTDDGRATKIKSPYYLVKKLMARRSNFDNVLASKGKATVDEEYYPMIDYINENKGTFVELDEQQRLEFMREYLNV